MSTSTTAFHIHLVRIERSLAFALAAQDPDDPQLQASFRKEVEAGVACLHGCVARKESVHPTLLMLSAVAESADAQKSGRTIDFKSIRKEDGRIAEGWRAAATTETLADVGAWRKPLVGRSGSYRCRSKSCQAPAEVDGGEADASAALAKRTRVAAVPTPAPAKRPKRPLSTSSSSVEVIEIISARPQPPKIAGPSIDLGITNLALRRMSPHLRSLTPQLPSSPNA
ncbi:hypothetical protein A0H81_02898 [Grifola frondosa]|uniref:Uncharacterized protein n=1 Tax=Grifola frondosa TaxID=5627 RepID=A0A1C7MLD8_GRIFR|nr:hypothetical protein A0H81_02898 [Grifola frondosa]